jgi:hypothetical protein
MPDLTVKGTAISFKMRDRGRTIVVRKSYGMIHDADGVGLLPRCTLLVGPYSQGVEIAASDAPRAARKWLGEDWVFYRGRADIPLGRLDLNTDGWKELGEVARVDYTRTGVLNEPFYHDFSKRIFLVFPARTVLYKRGKWLRLELPWGCRLNERGFLAP